MADKRKGMFLKNYAFSLILIGSIMLGSVIGLILKEKAVALKPLGDIFLNLLFTIVVPLVFFSISSAVASMSDVRRLGKIISWMLVIFVATSFISSLLMIGAVKIFPVVQGMQLPAPRVDGPQAPQINFQVGQGTDGLKLSGTVGVVVFMGALTLLPAMFLLGVAALGLCFLFLTACEKI